MHNKMNAVRLAALVLGYDEKLLVGRPDDVEFGPFTFYTESLPVTAAAGNLKLNIPLTGAAAGSEGTTDKKLNALSASQRYWLYFAGFSAQMNFDADLATAENQGRFMANMYLGMERNSQFSYEMMAYGIQTQSPTAGGTNAASDAINIADKPAHMFKYWWILDGEDDDLFANTDVDFAGGGNLSLWMYGFAVSKSIQAEVAQPQCGPAALQALATEGPGALDRRASLLGLI